MVMGKSRFNRLISLVLRLDLVIILLNVFVSYVIMIDWTYGRNSISNPVLRTGVLVLICKAL